MKLKTLALGSLAVMLSGVTVPVSAGENDYITYKVEAKDTLYDLARLYFKSPENAGHVQRINRLTDPKRMQVDQTLRIPRSVLRYDNVAMRIAAYSGSVKVDGSAPRVGAIVDEGEIIDTGPNGFISLSAEFGGRVSLPSNTSARLVTARRYLLGNTLDVDFAVTRGRANASSPSLIGQDRLQMRTPLAVTAVRGTEFRIAYDPDKGEYSFTEVTEGRVAVSIGEEEQFAPAGFGIAGTSEGLLEPEKLLQAPSITDPGKVQTAEMLEFSVEPVSGAKAYRVQLARDAGFVDLIDETVIETPVAQLGGPDNGRYFVRARAIANSGLEGQSETYSFLRKRLGVSASAMADEAGYRFGWLAHGEEKALYAFQLWAEASPHSLLFDELGLQVSEVTLTDLEPGRYQWRVAAISSDPEEGLVKVWGAPQTLVVTK